MTQIYEDLALWAKNLSVLIIEADADVRTTLKEFLTSFFSKVTTVSNGLEAYHHLHHQPDYNIIISDIKMPQMDGLQIAKLIENRYKGKKLILISGQTIPAEIERWSDLKVNLFMAKPLQMDQLMNSLVGFCKEIKAA